MLERRYGGKALDWGGSRAPLKRQSILDFLREIECIGIDDEWRRKAIEKVMTLDPHKVYLLYAYES